MQGQSVHKAISMIKGGSQYSLRPFIIVCVCTATNLIYGLIPIIISHIGLVSAVQIPIILGTHIAAAAPVLITHTKIGHLPGCLMAVFLTQIRHRGHTLKGHVLHPLAHFLDGSASHITVHISLAAKLPAQLHEFMGTEAVVLYYTAPVGIDHFLSLLFGTDSISPVILIRKASSRPTKHRNLNLLQRLYHIISHAVCIGNIGIFSHIQTAINTSSQML